MIIFKFYYEIGFNNSTFSFIVQCISAYQYIYCTFYSLISYQARESLGMNFGTSIGIVISVIIIIVSNFNIRNTSLHLSKNKKCLKNNVRDIYSASPKLCTFIVLQTRYIQLYTLFLSYEYVLLLSFKHILYLTLITTPS